VTVEKRVPAILIGLIALDVTIATVAFAFPQLWYTVFHGVGYVDPQGLLRRMGANWAAFALLQIVAWRRWREEPVWLAIVAGARWSDGLTDWTYLVFANDLTWFARVSLFAASPMNWIAGWMLYRAYEEKRA
jgi:hypothetical protein